MDGLDFNNCGIGVKVLILSEDFEKWENYLRKLFNSDFIQIRKQKNKTAITALDNIFIIQEHEWGCRGLKFSRIIVDKDISKEILYELLQPMLISRPTLTPGHDFI